MGLTFVTSRSPRERAAHHRRSRSDHCVVAAHCGAVVDRPGRQTCSASGRASSRATTSAIWAASAAILGFLIALDEPFGIGPLQFPRCSSPRTRTTPFSTPSCRAAGSPASYFTLVLDLGDVRRAFPHRADAVAADLPGGLCRLSRHRRRRASSIDIDHWRHYFLILGVLWGLMAASWSYSRNSYAGRQSSA